MTKSIRFIHAADLHLGAGVRGLCGLSPEWAARIQRAIPEAYDRVIDAAIANEVDFVVIAGDVFDTSRPSYGDYVHFFEGLGKLHEAGIPSYIVAGNHDPFTTWARDVDQLPPSARLLGVGEPQFALFSKNDEPLCLVGGRSYYNQTWPDDQKVAAGISREKAVVALRGEYRDAASAPFAIGVIHTGLDIDAGKAPSNEADLLARDIDYWACGHLHKHLVRPSVANPRIVFSGCVQARDMKETGERGCYLVELREGSAPSLEFIPTASVIMQQMEVRVGASQTLADLARLVQAELFRENATVHCDDMVVRITLVGETELHRFLAKREILEDLRKRINDAYPTFFCDALIDRTTFPRHGETPLVEEEQGADNLAAPMAADAPGGLFTQIVAELAAEQRSREDVMINFVQNEFVKRGIAVPSSLSRRVGDFTEAAETLVTDLLREEAE